MDVRPEWWSLTVERFGAGVSHSSGLAGAFGNSSGMSSSVLAADRLGGHAVAASISATIRSKNRRRTDQTYLVPSMFLVWDTKAESASHQRHLGFYCATRKMQNTIGAFTGNGHSERGSTQAYSPLSVRYGRTGPLDGWP